MKNLLTALSLVLGLGFASAQSTQPSTAKQAPTKVSQEAKKDAKVATAPATTASTTKPSSMKLKKDGTPDKRYKENQKLKKDGTPDKRYKENK